MRKGSVTLTYSAESTDGLTVGELKALVEDLEKAGISDTVVPRVRTKLGANSAGSVIRTISVSDRGE